MARGSPPAWNVRLLAWIEGLPGPVWLPYVGLLAGWSLVVNILSWASGHRDLFVVDWWQTSIPLIVVCAIGLIHAIGRRARSTFGAFRPILDAPDAEARDLEEDLVAIPGRPATVIAMTTVAITTTSFFVEPLALAAARAEGLAGAMLVVGWTNYAVAQAILGVLFYSFVHRLRRVSRLQSRSTRIDLFAPSPLYAFSRLTAMAGIGLIGLAFLLAAIVSVAAPPIGSLVIASPVFGGFLFVVVALAVAAFVLPLRGMQAKIADEKERLQLAVDRRITEVIARIHAGVDRDDLSRAAELQTTLASLGAEREIIGKLRTWPWSTGTFRGFVSAVLLPVGLWILTRLLERFV